MMDKKQALDIVLKALEIAQKAGAFTLEDAKVVAIAKEVLLKPDEVKEEVKEEPAKVE